MDSHFINFDGRSVHDMIELLLAASGDPEAIARLQQAIQSVDAKFGPVDTELARLEEDKQDVGDYVENGGGDFSWLKFARGCYIGRMNRGANTEGLRIWGQYDKEESGYNLDGLVFNHVTKQILHQVYNADESTWETLATYSADEDTGWLTLESNVQNVGYRKKNGVVYLNTVGNVKEAVSTTTPTLLTLPEGIRPAGIILFTYTTRNNTGNYGFVEQNGALRIHVNSVSDIAVGDQIFLNVSYPV